MKILHLDSGTEWRGGQQQLSFLAAGLAELRGIDQCFAIPANGLLRTRIASLKLPLHPVAMRGEGDPLAISRLYFLARRWRPDVIHAHDARTLGLASVLKSLGVRSRIVAHRRVIFPIKDNPFSKRKYREAADCIIAVSAYIRELLRNYGVSPERIRVVYDSLELPRSLPEDARNRARRDLGLGPEALVIGCVGHFSPEKGHIDLIKGFFRIQAQLPEARLILIGDGPLREEYRKLIAQLDLSKKIFLPGFVENLQDFFAAMDLFVFPSLSEGLGSVLLKAMSYRVPVIASQVGGIPEIVVDGVTGFLFPPGDPVAMADRVLYALGDMNQLRRCKENATRRLNDDFSVVKMSEATAQIYSNVLGA
ncbi:MAG: glycosyltransferase [Terriglobia bacterium]